MIKLKLERRHQALIPADRFARRMAIFSAFAASLVLLSLGLGMAGYHWLESLSWLDSLLNASMLLGGMGPVDLPKTEAGKLFASFYALYAGMVILAAFGVLISPVAHRLLHAFHVPEEAESRPRRRPSQNKARQRK